MSYDISFVCLGLFQGHLETSGIWISETLGFVSWDRVRVLERKCDDEYTWKDSIERACEWMGNHWDSVIILYAYSLNSQAA